MEIHSNSNNYTELLNLEQNVYKVHYIYDKYYRHNIVYHMLLSTIKAAQHTNETKNIKSPLSCQSTKLNINEFRISVQESRQKVLK